MKKKIPLQKEQKSKVTHKDIVASQRPLVKQRTSIIEDVICGEPSSWSAALNKKNKKKALLPCYSPPESWARRCLWAGNWPCQSGLLPPAAVGLQLHPENLWHM